MLVVVNKLLFYILGGLILSTSAQLTHSTVSVDNSLRPYYNEFIRIANKCEVNVNESELRVEIQYDIGKKSYYAITYTEINLIIVNYVKFKTLPESWKEQTILHELGHALLDLRHDDSDLNLMNALGFIDKDDYVKYYDYYIRKLFKNCKYKGSFVHE